jgi:hypothetical protein
MLYAVRLVRLPFRVKGVVVRDEEDFYNIYINDQLGKAEQKKALDHEIEHIERGDIDNEADIKAVEELRS